MGNGFKRQRFSVFSSGVRSFTKLLAPRGVLSAILKFLCLAILDAFALWFFWHAFTDGVWFLAAAIALITIGINIIFLNKHIYPFRWLSPTLALLLLMVIYPLAYTVYVAFTNQSETHLITKQQAINFLQSEEYLPSDAITFTWTAFRSPQGEFAVWLISEEDGQRMLAKPGEPFLIYPQNSAGIAALDQDGIPIRVEGYERLSRADSVRYIQQLSDIDFGKPPETISVKSLDKAAQYKPKYSYDSADDTIIDAESGVIYRAVEGTFTSPSGGTLQPSFAVPIGWKNFERLFTSIQDQTPLFLVFIWTIEFAFLATLGSLAVGLFLAVIFSDKLMPAKIRKFIQSILILPYIMPFFLSILIWRGMLNQHIGIINKILVDTIGFSPPWLSDQFWTRAAILIISLWLGFPYMMLISTGALQAIPVELYEAATVDGANEIQRFWHVTLPLLLTSIGPLLVLSFAFNFNNFNLIYLFNGGGPPIPNTPTPVGYSDILITYSHNLAFEIGRGGDYGYAAAVSVVIFLVVAAIALIQIRYMGTWEDITRNA